MNKITETTIEADPKIPVIRMTRDFAATPEQRGIGVGAEQLPGRGREVTRHPDDRECRVGFDGRLGDLVHALPRSFR